MSELAVKANNLFGLEKSQVWNGEVISIPTREFIDGKWINTFAIWPVFASGLAV
jgi:flagellum-specific peptidoglycan hydrolase FlgJ